MAYSLPLSRHWRQQGWKAKIRDRERVEPPHVTIMRKTQAWRLDLRSGEFMDARPDPTDLPAELLEEIRSARETLVAEWNRMYPENPVGSEDDTDEQS